MEKLMMVQVAMFLMACSCYAAAVGHEILFPPPISLHCKGGAGALIKNCADYVKVKGPLVPPSGACCSAIHKADIPCLCKKYVNKKVEKLISMKKAVYVAEQCKRPFAHKSKCGEYTIP